MTDLYPCWYPCPLCEDYLCHRHAMHAFECPCPGIEEWQEQGVYPYVDEAPENFRPGKIVKKKKLSSGHSDS